MRSQIHETKNALPILILKGGFAGLFTALHLRDLQSSDSSVEMLPNLESDICLLIDAQAQADPKFQSTFLYARISARAVQEVPVFYN